MTTKTIPVAGLDLLIERQRDADAVGQTIAAGLVAKGAVDVFVASHWVSVRDLRHVALSVSAGGVEAPNSWWEVLSQAVRGGTGNRICLALGDHFIGSPELHEPVAGSVQAHLSRTSGRVIVFPGGGELTGAVSVEQIVAVSAIDRVRVLAGGRARPDTIVRTRDFLRPYWSDGDLVLDVQPSVGGTLVPFETPFLTPCCGDHA